MTLVLTFQSPAPVAVERIAAYVNGTTIGPYWHVPMHYIKQFHPKYNKSIDPKSTWQTKHDAKLLWNMNPDCPTMVGYKCAKYSEGRAVYWERNPYYYGVTKDGDQLPYIDKWQWICTVDPQVQKLAMAAAKIDYVHCRHWPVTLADFSTFKKAEAKGGLKVQTWDTGSGTGSITFFNFDTPDEDLRNLLAEKDFRLALSYAFNRPLARKAIYFETGELTTGTLSPKGVSFQVNDQAKQIYAQWRDSAIKYDPDQAKKLLDGLGLKDADGDGFREYKNGKKLTLRLDYPANTSQENIDKCTQQRADWQAVGLKVNINPTAPTTFGDQWGRGQLMTTTAWEIGDNSPYIYAGWVVPVANSWWAPLTGPGLHPADLRPLVPHEAEGHQPVEADAAVPDGVRRYAAGQDVRRPAEHLRRGSHRAGPDEADPGVVGDLQGPHRPGPVHVRHRGELAGHGPAARRPPQHPDPRPARSRRLDQPVVPPVACGVRPGGLLLGQPGGPHHLRSSADLDGLVASAAGPFVVCRTASRARTVCD